MISYRKLAMRVLGHPLRVPTNTPRPASHRVTALALTAAMVAGMAAPAYAGTYYIGDGDITITKDESGTYVKQGNNSSNDGKGDKDNTDIVIKGGKRSEDTTGTGSEGGNSSEGDSSGTSSPGTGTPANSPVQSASATLKVEDSENEDKDMVYPGDTKGSDSSDGSGEENENQSTEKNQTGDTTDGKNTGAGSSDPESKGSEGGTTGSEGDTTGGEENDPKPGGTPTPAEGTESTESNRSAPESQFTYTSANDDEETRNESTTVLKRAAENFKNTAENVTNYVIRIINKATGNDNTLNVTLDNVNIDVSSSKTNNAALSVEGAGDTKITLEGKNTLTSGNQCAGLEHNEESMGTTGKLTITSGTDDNGSNTGSLTATGSGGSAGIGSAWSSIGSSSGAGTIEITGGDITAIGASDAAGIGSGYGATSDTHIIINGTAKVDAQATQNGAGIGSGHNSTGNTTIDIGGDAIVKAQGGSDAAGIGSGDGSTGTTTINISGGTIVEAVGGTNGDGIGGSSSNRNNPTTVTISGGTIQKAQGGQGHGSYDGGSGIHSDGDLTISGNAHIVSATGGDGDSSNSRSDAGDGIRAGTLTISGEARIDNATGGTADSGSAGDGIYNYGKLTIKDNAKIGTVKGGDATASGKDGGYGIRNHGQFTMSGGTITNAVGGKATGRTGDGGDGIYCGDTLTIEGGEIQQTTGGDATGESGTGGSGIYSDGKLTIDSATIENATGGSGKWGGSGILGKTMEILTSTIKKAIGGRSTGEESYHTGGAGIAGSESLTIKGGTKVQAVGGDADSGTGGSGIRSGSDSRSGSLSISGGTINTTGGSGKSGGAGVSTESGIVSIGNSDTPLDLTATAPDADNAIRGRDGKKLDEIIHLEENGKLGLVKLVENGVTRLFHNGVYTKTSLPGFSVSETHPLGEWRTTKAPTCTEPGKKQRSCTVKDCVVTETEELPALGHQWSGWTPVEGGSREYRICAVCNAVEYRDVSHNSGFIIPTNLRVLDSTQTDILQNAQLVRLNQINDVLYIDVALETASLQGVLSDLTGLRSENIETIVFSTERCTSTLSLSDVAALGAGDTPFTLSHSGSTATFIVGGADHSALLR